jgi:hypothetical protein
MSKPYLAILFFLHALGLLYYSRSTSRLLFASPFLKVFGGIALIWMNLVHTSQILSLFGSLGSPVAYFLTPIGLHWCYLHLFTWLCRDTPPSPAPESPEFWREIKTNLLSIGLLLAFAAVATGALLIAVSVLNNNWDTLAYRFPRVLFYLSSGALVHPGQGIDPRLLNYPYNASLIYLFLAQYEWTGVAWNFVSLTIWMIATAGVFYFPLSLGASGRSAVFSAVLFATAPIVLCLANSGNDELIAGTPGLLAVIFLGQWFRFRHIACLIFFMILLAISAGTKLHIVFLLPVLLLAALVCFIASRRELATWCKESLRGHTPHLAVGLLLSLPLAGGFLVTNLVSSGKLTNSEFNKAVLNFPPNPVAATQTLWLYSWQLLLSPLPDHALPFGKEVAAKAYATANSATADVLFKNIKQGAPYTNPYYSFRGLVPPDAMQYYEQTLWLGLFPWLLILSLIWLAFHRQNIPVWQWALFFVLPGWHVVISTALLYSETVGAYYAYAAPLGFAGFAFVVDKIRQEPGWSSRSMRLALTVVMGSNLWLAASALTLSPQRNVTQAFIASDRETATSQTSPNVRSMMQQARRIQIEYSHWELLYWNLMRLNPAAEYFTSPTKQATKPDLTIYPLGSRFNWGTPTPIRARGIGAYRFGGTITSGEELIFCQGPACRPEHPDWDEFFFLPMLYSASATGVELAAAGPPLGLNPGQSGFARFTLFRAGTQEKEASPWIPVSNLATFRNKFTNKSLDHLQVEVSCASDNTCILSKSVFPLQPGPRPLIDPMPELAEAFNLEQISSLFSPAWEGSEGGGYWKFIWRLVPGTNRLEAEWTGGGGEKAKDLLTVISVSDKGVVLRREGTNGNYTGTWLTQSRGAVRGGTSWDPNNTWNAGRQKSTVPAR